MSEPVGQGSLGAIVLAAGLGTRMRSSVIKVLHRLCGRPMIEYPLRMLAPLGVTRTVLVLGHQADAVAAQLRERAVQVPDLRIAMQEQQRGTADAVRCALPQLPAPSGAGAANEKILILYGDTPLLRLPRLRELLQAAQGRKLAFLGTILEDPSGYGRVARNANGQPVRIIEDRDCSPEDRKLREINAGIYVVDGAFLREALTRVAANNAQRELYLTDLVALAAEAGDEVTVVHAPPDEVLGVNDRVDLATAETILRRRINETHLRAGVTLRDPATTYIDDEVTIGSDTELGPGVSLRGRTTIAARCLIDTGTVLTNVTVDEATHIKPYTVATDAVVGDKVALGPFSHLRPGSILMSGAHVGNFVELKQTRLGAGSKANHLAYLGDAEIGRGVNVGCGTITCNYDGFSKHRTVIEDDVFIGSDTQLVAPVRVGRGAIIAAGTTVISDVPAQSLTLSRVAQVNKLGYAQGLRDRLRAEKKEKPKPSG